MDCRCLDWDCPLSLDEDVMGGTGMLVDYMEIALFFRVSSCGMKSK
jgi:hypothetical protein